MTWARDVVNPEEVHPAVVPQMESAVSRALYSGAKPPLTYVGAGMTSVVLCDESRRAWKVGRYVSPSIYRGLQAEAEFLFDAALTPAASLVAQIFGWHGDLMAIERECIDGRPAGWGTRGVRELYDRITSIMRPLGWSGPEYKEDSFVVEEGTNRLVLVDAGYVHRRGDKLLDYVYRTIRGEELHSESLSDLHWQVRMDTVDGLFAPTVGIAAMEAIEEVSSAGEELARERERLFS